MKRILALLLTVIMMFGTFAIDIAAGAVPIKYVKRDGKDTEEIDWEATLEQYLTLEFANEQAKLESMEMMYEKDGYQLWIDDYTGEVATVNVATGQILFSNPYDIGSTTSSGPIKSELYSQILVKYTDNDTDKTMNSFTEAASRGQIEFDYIKNGIRVEYSIGREETRVLVPRQIERSRFENYILQPFADEINKISEEMGCNVLNWRDYLQMAKRNKMIEDSSPTGNPKDGNTEWFKFVKLLAFYSEKFLGECETEKERRSMEALYPITKKMDIWVCTPDVSRNELITIEGYIKTFVPSYTFEQLEYDHQLTEYEGQDKAPPLFKMALEYTLDEMGMSVRLPANGLRFDESLYQLTYVSILPYMGAGANYLLNDEEEAFTGYNFFPDGAGTLFRHEDLVGKSNTVVNGKVYGQDFAYNTIVGSNQQTIRYPVFGIVSNTHRTEEVVVEQQITEESVDLNGNVIIINTKDGTIVNEHKFEEVAVEQTVKEDKGFVAIIEEGDALAELSDYHMGSSGKYNTVQMLFYPRPKDSYNLANAISVGANATWTVVSSRKYVGNYKIRYIMLTDEAIAEEKQIADYYECSWMGMAEAYRDYLYSKGELDSLTEEDIQDDIPMYIETFGTLETLEKIMSIPVNVMTSLTSFENVKTMYDELSAEGVSNIKFKLHGYANGGMYSSVPYRLEWEKSVGGDEGYEDLLAYSAEKGFDVFPEFDFAYVSSITNTLFDGLTLKKHIVKSINDTYMSRRYYSATRQTHVGRFELAISAAYYSHFYDKLTANLMKNYEGSEALKAISVSTLGSNLNSDFDEDEPYNREDTKKYTQQIFDKMSQDYDVVMTEAANSYTWKYVDYIINAPLDSSRYNMSANSVPFIGVVLHGSVQFAGTPLNMEGNIGYSMLKAIENGAGLYFILCYENYEELKEDATLADYYSVRYDILKEDVVKYYTVLNDLTKDLQLYKIVDHKFLIGERVPDEDEVIADAEALKKEEELAAELAAQQAAKDLQAALLEGRVYAASISATAAEEINKIYTDIEGYYNGGIVINNKGIVTIRPGMNTLVKDALAKAERKNPLEAAYALANAWDRANKSFANFVLTGSNKARADLEKALSDAKTSYTIAVDAVPQRKGDLETAILTAIDQKINSIPNLLKSYDSAVAAAEAVADKTSTEYTSKLALADAALAKITKFFASVDEVRAYDAANTAKTAAQKAMDTRKAALEKENRDATSAYEKEQIRLAATLQNNAEYLAKVQLLNDATLNHSTLGIIRNNLVSNLDTYATNYPDSPEHKLILSYIADYEQKLADSSANIKKLTDEVDAYYTAADASFAAVKSAAEAAQAIVDAEFLTDAEYAAQNAILEANDATMKTLSESFVKTARAAYDVMVTEYSALNKVLVENTDIINGLKAAASSGAEYDKLVADVEAKKAALAAVTDAYTEDETYKMLVEKLVAPTDAKITELVAQIAGANADAQIKLANQITSLMSDKYKKVKIPTDLSEKSLMLSVEKNSDGLVIGGGYIVNDYITKFKAEAEKSEAYTVAKEELKKAEDALSAFETKAGSAASTKPEYLAANTKVTETRTAMNKYDLDNTNFKNALSQFLQAEVNVGTAEAKVTAAQKALDSAKPYAGVDNYSKVLEAYKAAMAPNDQILVQYQSALKDYNTAFGYVKSQITSINTLFKNLDAQTNTLNTALKNSDIAKKHYNDAQFAGVYSAEFLAAIDNEYKATLENTKAGNEVVEAAYGKFVDALNLAKQIIPNTESELEFTAIRIEIKADGSIVIPEAVEIPEEEETEEEEETGYEYTKYTDDSGNIAYVEYENGTFFILNYNDYAVTVVYEDVQYTLDVYGGVKVTADGKVDNFKTVERN